MPGASVKAVFGAMLQAICEGGGDPPASRWPMGAGDKALFGRYHTGDETVGEQDQVVFEPGAAYRHYHACTMYNILTGRPRPRHVAMNRACADALDACQIRSGPAAPSARCSTCTRGPSSAPGSATPRSPRAATPWGQCIPDLMDWPMLWSGNPQVIEPGMVFFLHMILFDREEGLSMAMGETAIVTEGACERVNHIPRELIVN